MTWFNYTLIAVKALFIHTSIICVVRFAIIS